MSAVTVQLPDSIFGKLTELAREQGTSVEVLIAAAASEKLAAMMEGTAYLRREGAKGSREDFERILKMAPDVPAEAGDSIE